MQHKHAAAHPEHRKASGLNSSELKTGGPTSPPREVYEINFRLGVIRRRMLEALDLNPAP